MSEKLTEDEIRGWEVYVRLGRRDRDAHPKAPIDALGRALAEIRAHRASALTDEDREALVMVAADLREFGMCETDDPDGSATKRAIEVLDRLTKGGAR